MSSPIVGNFLSLFECVISLAVDDITGSFERAIFNVSQLAMPKAVVSANRVVSKVKCPVSHCVGKLRFFKTGRTLL